MRGRRAAKKPAAPDCGKLPLHPTPFPFGCGVSRDGLSRQDKLGKGGSSQTETFQRDPVGNQSNLAKLGQQPEASLAWSGVTLAVKRRQRSQKPCDSASIGVRARESLLLT
jgi:hypothetical protein